MSRRGIDLSLFGRASSWMRRLRPLQLWLRKRRLRREAGTIVLAGDMAVCRVLGRWKLFVDPRDYHIAPHVMLDGIWEPGVTEVMADLLRPGMVAIDAGANFGYFSVLMAGQVGASGRVLAFEPNPDMARRLEATISLNDLGEIVEVYAVPLAEESGRPMIVVIPDHSPGGANIVDARSSDCLSYDVVTQRLDEVAGALDADFAKIDVEGFEEAIWHGMSGLIAGSRLRTIILEFVPSAYRDPAGLVGSMLAAGFVIATIEDGPGVRPISRDALLDGSHTLRMLLLRR